MRRSSAPSKRAPGFTPPVAHSPSSHGYNQNNLWSTAPNRAPLHAIDSNQNTSDNGSKEEDETSIYRYFSCVWAKKSGRKHKKWEGDALIKVGTRSVVLVDTEGKELGRGSGYKIQELAELEDGGRLTVGSKEVEITGAEDSQAWASAAKLAAEERSERRLAAAEGKHERQTSGGGTNSSSGPPPSRDANVEPSAQTKSTVSHSNNFKPFKVPSRLNTNLNNFVPERRVQPGVAMFDVNRPEALVFPRPPASHSLSVPDRLVDVVLDPYISKHLRPHQREGVMFLYSNLLGFKTLPSSISDEPATINGAILADEMGLGKTLQTVSLIWTFLKQSPIAGTTLARKVLIVTPSSLLKNWENEFRKWLGTERITIHIADTGEKVAQFRGYNTAPVLMLSYEMLVRTAAELLAVSWDLVVCDEAHRMKNNTIKTSSCLAQIPCARKLLLTGTPVQNDLGEFYNLVELACPGILGTRAQFSRNVESRVEASRQPDATVDELEEGEMAMEEMNKITNYVILRRTSDIINQFLPPKTVYVVFCRATPHQERVYTREVDRLMETLGGGHQAGQHLAAITTLRKICNAPSLVEDSCSWTSGAGPETWEEQSGKLATLTCLLLQLAENTQEKIVLVSLSTATLDLLQTLCDKYGLSTCRLDGSTPPKTRQSIVNNFNTGAATRVMLLSSKAGGTGLNLIGASRLVLYDIDWNPATDLQAMARIWRDGQRRPCHVYRLVTTATIEEKILQRQVTKRGLDSSQVVPAHFSQEELRDLFSFDPATECDTHDRMGCECGGAGGRHQQLPRPDEDAEERSCQLGGGGARGGPGDPGPEDQLADWAHVTSPVEDMMDDPILSVASPYVSFVMMKSFFSDSNKLI